MGPTLGVVGDDVTGVLSVGGEIASRGVPTTLSRGPGHDVEESWTAVGDGKTGDCVLMSTDSRHDSPARAFEKAAVAAATLKEAGVRYLVKKTDSLLRGNIGPEILGAREGFGAGPGLCIFAAPSQGRTTVNGIQLVSRRRLATVSDPGSYVRSGAPESNVYKLLKAHTSGVRHLNLDIVERGEAEVAVALARCAEADDLTFVVCDAASTDQVSTTVRAAVTAGYRLFVGTSDMGFAMADALIAHGELPAAPAVLIVSGTLSATGREQVHHAVTSGLADLVEVDLVPSSPDVRDHVEPDDAVVERLIDGLASGRTTILTAAGDPPAQDAPADIAHIVADGLGALTAGALGRVSVAGVVATGGDIAEALLRALGAEQLYLTHEVLPGVPEAVIADGPHAGLRFVAKAGSFGPLSSFHVITRWLQTSPPHVLSTDALHVGDAR